MSEQNNIENEMNSLIKEFDQQEQREQRILGQILSKRLQKKGYVLAVSSMMGKTLSSTGNAKGVPSYNASHSLEWIAGNIKLGSQMPFMKNKINEEDGRLIVDNENAEEIKQRAPDWSRQAALAAYLAQDGRKFGPIIAVLNPPWIDDPKHENWGPDGRALVDAAEFEPLDQEGKVGLLRVGEILIYALDGQHRIIGIKGIKDVRDNPMGLEIKNKFGKATSKNYSQEEFMEIVHLNIEDLQSLLNESMGVEYIPAVIAGETREEASRRIRSVFISINSYAKKTDKGENILLDETDGYAIIARKAGLYHNLFNGSRGNNRVNWKNTSIPKKRTNWYTTLQTIREMAYQYLQVLDDDTFGKWEANFKGQMPIRPSDQELDDGKDKFFEVLSKIHDLPIFKELEGFPSADQDEELMKIREFPTDDEPSFRGHLLLRPHGQILLVKAIAKLIHDKTTLTLDQIFDKIKAMDNAQIFHAHEASSPWWGVTYDGKFNKMIIRNESWAHLILVWMIDGLRSDEKEGLWAHFSKARTTDPEGNEWINSQGKKVNLDTNVIDLPRMF
jgi:DGQHR domain-containing protein